MFERCKMKNHDEVLYRAIRSMYYTIVTDEKGNVICLSKNYEDLLGVRGEDYIGKSVQNLIENSEIPRVIQTKKEEIGHLFTLKNGLTVVCNRIPVIENDILYGVISSATFYDLSEVSLLNDQIEKLRKENLEYKKKITELYSKQKYSIDQIIGDSAQVMDIKNIVQRFADSNLTFLITGETGTGKEVFANAIHKLSSRKSENFVKINCAAIPKDLLESELFGYEAGSFSGALKSGKMGKFELANHGTLLLDEIGEMPLALQSKLLRVLQENELERIGGLETIKLDVRIICSTNQNIEEQVEKGLFRKDLYYRINVIEINLPPLRNRLEDIVPLSKFFISKINKSYGLDVTEIKKEVYALFNEYEWIGNVRELQHVLERACITAGAGALKLEHFDFLLSRIYKKDKLNNEILNDINSLNNITAEVEKEKIIKTLIETKGNKTSAAKLLNIDRSSLYNKLKKYNIDI